MEFAVSAVAARRGTLDEQSVPAELRPWLRRAHLGTAGRRAVRRILDADDDLRRTVAALASPDLVDEIGLLWLRRPAGWEDTVDVLLGEGGGGATPSERRRRQRAESAADRWQAEAERLRRRLVASEAGRDDALAGLAATAAQLDAQRAEWAAAMSAADRRLAEAMARHQVLAVERDAALARLASSEAASAAAVDGLRRAVTEAESARDAVLAERAAGELPLLARVLPGVSRARPARRHPIGLPGGLRADAPAATEHVLRTAQVVVLVDGYNVAKLAWPEHRLDDQRELLVEAAERVARRWGTEIVVVFDGAEVVGAATASRRVVAVTFSPAGVTADDVLRRLAAALPADRPVVVVTDDRAIIADVRRLGCNVLPSAAFAATANR